MIKLSEDACVREIDVLPLDGARPEEDIGFVVASGKQRINIWGGGLDMKNGKKHLTTLSIADSTRC